MTFFCFFNVFLSRLRERLRELIFPTENKMSSTLQNIVCFKRFYSLRFTAQWLNINVESLWDIFKTWFLKNKSFKGRLQKLNPHVFYLDVVNVEVKDEVGVCGWGRGVVGGQG